MKVCVIVVDLRDEIERREAFASDKIKNKELIREFVAQGRTQFGYDKETGDVLFAVDKGELVHIGENNNVSFKPFYQI